MPPLELAAPAAAERLYGCRSSEPAAARASPESAEAEWILLLVLRAPPGVAAPWLRAATLGRKMERGGYRVSVEWGG